jgi:hypothetical protein
MASALFTSAKAWRIDIHQHTQSPLDAVIKIDIKNIPEARSSSFHVCFYDPLTDNFLYSISWTP